MASYNELNALIDAYINRNGVQAITGQILNGVLKAMVEQLGRGYTIMGAAIPTTDPGTPDGPECYFASETGTYTDFDGLQVAPGELALLCYTPSDGWTKATIYEGFRQVGATIDGNVGTPSVGVSYANGVLSFDFHNMKGNPGQDGQDGQDGAAAGFGTIGADITGGVGTPGVSVESSGPATAKKLQFHFTNLKGETGVTSVVATVDNTTGNPACTVSLVGQQLTLAFTGLKGAQGDTGSSVDYPFTIVNNLTTNDATQALSAAMGVQLEAEVSQLEAKVDENANFTETEEGSLVATTSETGMVSASQTVGQPVVLDRRSGYGNIQYFEAIPANSALTINFSAQTGMYGFALCDANGIVLEYCTNTGLDSYTFQSQNIVTYLYASSNKFASGTYITTTLVPVKDSITALESRVDSIEEDVATIGAKCDSLDVEVNGKPLVSIDLSEYDEVPGFIWGGYYRKDYNYGYHRCKFVPIDEYRGREMELVAVQNPELYSQFYVLKNIPDTSVSQSPIETPTGYENVIILTPSSPTYDFTVPQDAGCLCIYVMDTRDSVDMQPSSVSVLPLAPIFYSRQETDEKIAEELSGYYTKEEIDEKETIIETKTEELAPYYIAQGYVSIYQTVGNTVAFIEDTGYGDIYGFPVIPANSVVTVNFSAQTGAYGFALCDENDKVIEFCSNSGLESYTFARTSVKTKLYASSSKLDTAIRVTTTEETVKEAIVRIDQEIDPKANRWTGKTIWWCGTSIPAGSDATIPGAEETIAGNYPTEVGNDLGATVINKAVGGSMCRANVRTGDYVGANFSNITSALTMTKAEIENFITNYSTIKNVLTGSVPATLGTGDIERLRAASFEDRLLPYLNGTYDMPDLFVFDHGHNDFKYTLSGGGTDIGLQPTVANIGGELTADTYMTANNNEKLESFFGSLANIPSSKKNAFIASVNRNCFIGSVNFLVTLILHYNPHARILFVSNYEYENGDAAQYAPLIPAQDSIAKSWAFPICRVYEYLGFSNHLIPGSMAWFNTTYPAQTPATTDITVYRAYLPDTVHPHSDITGDANNIYAGIISEFIKKIY